MVGAVTLVALGFAVGCAWIWVRAKPAQPRLRVAPISPDMAAVMRANAFSAAHSAAHAKTLKGSAVLTAPGVIRDP